MSDLEITDEMVICRIDCMELAGDAMVRLTDLCSVCKEPIAKLPVSWVAYEFRDYVVHPQCEHELITKQLIKETQTQ